MNISPTHSFPFPKLRVRTYCTYEYVCSENTFSYATDRIYAITFFPSLESRSLIFPIRRIGERRSPNFEDFIENLGWLIEKGGLY